MPTAGTSFSHNVKLEMYPGGFSFPEQVKLNRTLNWGLFYVLTRNNYQIREMLRFYDGPSLGLTLIDMTGIQW